MGYIVKYRVARHKVVGCKVAKYRVTRYRATRYRVTRYRVAQYRIPICSGDISTVNMCTYVRFHQLYTPYTYHEGIHTHTYTPGAYP